MKYYEIRGQAYRLVEDGRLVNPINHRFFRAGYVERLIENEAHEIDDIVSFFKHRITNLNASIKYLKEYLPYADGQSYYRDKDKIVEQEREIESIEKFLEDNYDE